MLTCRPAVLGNWYCDPFGARINPYGDPLTTIPGDVSIGFNGLDHDDDLGLINQRGRVYNPSLRRFLTPDPIISDPLNGQTYNPYSYVRNDPVNRLDPSGYCDATPCYEGGFITLLAEARGETTWYLHPDLAGVPSGQRLTLVAHGSPHDLAGLSPSEVAGILRANGLAPTSIKRSACWTGSGCFAPGLAREMGVIVRAPVGPVNVIEGIRA